MLQSPEAQKTYNAMTPRYTGKLVIAGVDELYQTNAIRYKLQAFHRLLREFPLFRQRLVLVQVCYRQRTAGTQQKTYELQITQAAAACNREFPGSIDLHMLTGSYYPIHQR